MYNRIYPAAAESEDFAQCGDRRPVVVDKFDFYSLSLVYRRGGFYGAAADGNIHDFSNIPPFINDLFFGLFISINEKETSINDYLEAAETPGGKFFDLS